MKIKLHPILKILKKETIKKGYKFSIIDKISNSLVKISNGKKVFFSNINKIGIYPLNAKFSSGIVTDKTYCYTILDKYGYKIPIGKSFFLNKNFKKLRGDELEKKDIIPYINKYIKYPVFIKPNNGSMGKFAEYIYNENQLKKYLKEVNKYYDIILVQKIIIEPEYRIFAIDGKIQFIYKRKSNFIIGDGQKSIKEKIEEKHKGKNINEKNNYFLKKILKSNNLTYNSILKKGQKLNISCKTNISNGGNIEEYQKVFSKKTKKWVKNVMNILGLRVCGIDIFSSGGVDNPDNFTIIEVNSSPSLSGIYKMGKTNKCSKIWRIILKKFFKD